MSSDSLADWLASHGMPQYAAAFAENAIDFDVLPDLDDEDLKSLGVESLGNRKRLLKAIRELPAHGRPSAAPVAAEPSPLTAGPTEPLAAGERRQLSIVFCDLVGSTALSSRLDPEDLRHIVREFHAAASGTAVRFGGYVAQFLGDGVLLYFGFPQAREDDAERAVRASMAIVEEVRRLRLRAVDALQVRIGIATGLVVLEQIGDGTTAAEQGATGSTPNLAARLQAVAGPDEIVIAESTRRLLGARFVFEPLRDLVLKGLGTTTGWRVCGLQDRESRFSARDRQTSGELVGRHVDLSLLRAKWESAQQGDGQALFIAGDAGHGKSRLCSEFLRELSPGSANVFELQCSPLFSSTSFHPFRRHILAASGIEPDDQPAQRGRKLLQWLEDVDPAPPGDDIRSLLALIEAADPRSDIPAVSTPAEIASALTNLMTRPGVHPVVVLVEDLHWTDPASEEVLSGIVTRLAQRQMLVLMTCRPEYTPTWHGSSALSRHFLGPVSAANARKLISAIDTHGVLTPEVITTLIERGDGVPLYLEEMTRAVLESTAEAPQGATQQSVPMTLQDSLMARLDKMGRARRIAQIASTIGREFSLALLQAVSTVAADELKASLGALVRADIVSQREDRKDRVYIFRHALLRDAAYASLTRATRQALHGAIAQALQARSARGEAVPSDLLAHHLEEAGTMEEARAAWHDAASIAFRRGMSRDAAAFCRRALKLFPDTHADQRSADGRLASQMLLSNSLLNAEGFNADSTRMAWQETGRLIASGRYSLDDRLQVLINSVPTTLASGRFENVFDAFAAPTEAELQQTSAATRTGLQAWYGLIHLYLGKYDKSFDYLSKAEQVLSTDPELDFAWGGCPAVISVTAYAMRCAYLSGRFRQMLQYRNKLRAFLATELAHPSACWTRQMLAWAEVLLERPEEAKAIAQEAEALAREGGLPTRVASGVMIRGMALIQLGQHAEGIRAATNGLQAWEQYGGKFHCSEYAAQIAGLLLRADARADMPPLLAHGEHIQATTDERLCESEMLRLRGRLKIAEGARDEGLALIRHACLVAMEDGAGLFRLRCATDLLELADSVETRGLAQEQLRQVVSEIEAELEIPEVRRAVALLTSG